MGIAESNTDLQWARNASKPTLCVLCKANVDVYLSPKSAAWIYDVGIFVLFDGS